MEQLMFTEDGKWVNFEVLHIKTIRKFLLYENKETKEKQLEVLEFLKVSGFDLIPKEITNKIINLIQGGMLVIPGLDLSIKNINLKKW